MEMGFDEQYVDAILRGDKKSTIRKGIKLDLLKKEKEGSDVIDLVANQQVFGRAKITKVIVKRVEELTENDALFDGFTDLEELMIALKNIYGELSGNDLVTIIYFDVIE